MRRESWGKEREDSGDVLVGLGWAGGDSLTSGSSLVAAAAAVGERKWLVCCV